MTTPLQSTHSSSSSHPSHSSDSIRSTDTPYSLDSVDSGNDQSSGGSDLGCHTKSDNRKADNRTPSSLQRTQPTVHSLKRKLSDYAETADIRQPPRGTVVGGGAPGLGCIKEEPGDEFEETEEGRASQEGSDAERSPETRPTREQLIHEYGYIRREVSPLYCGCWMRSAWYSIFAHVRSGDKGDKREFERRLQLLVPLVEPKEVNRFSNALMRWDAFKEGRFSQKAECSLIRLTESILEQDETYDQRYELPRTEGAPLTRRRRTLSDKRVVELLKENLFRDKPNLSGPEEYGELSMIIRLLLYFDVPVAIFSDAAGMWSQHTLDIREYAPDERPSIIIAHDGQHFEILEKRERVEI